MIKKFFFQFSQDINAQYLCIFKVVGAIIFCLQFSKQNIPIVGHNVNIRFYPIELLNFNKLLNIVNCEFNCGNKKLGKFVTSRNSISPADDDGNSLNWI